MDSLDDLFSHVLQNSTTFVYGNLGRLPQVVYNHLVSKYPTLDVIVQSKHYTFPTSDHISLDTGDTISKCDLYIVIEPPPYLKVGRKPVKAARMLVLTSHVVLDNAIDVAYFHSANLSDQISKIRRLLEVQDASIVVRDIESAKRRVDFQPTIVVGPDPSKSDICTVSGPAATLAQKSYVLIDLTGMSSALASLLVVWDAFDRLVANVDLVERWVLCFGEGRHATRPYDELILECINRLFCKKFEYGNVTSLARLLALTPFYKSGIADHTLKVETDTLGDLKYVSPKNPVEAYKACILYDLVHLAGSTYQILK